MRISCRLTFYVKFKPLIIKIGWELDILCYIFEIQRFDMQLLRFFLFFYFYFSVSFYLIWMKFLSKFRENVGLQAYCLGLVLNRSWTGLFWSFSKKLRGPGPLVRLNRLQSGLVLGPFPVLRTGPWSTNHRLNARLQLGWCNGGEHYQTKSKKKTPPLHSLQRPPF